MKRFFAIIGLALAMLTTSCSKDPISNESNLPSDSVTFTVSLKAEAARTSLGEFNGSKYVVLWGEGDKIGVNGVESAAVEAQYVGTSTATFTVADVTAPYNIIYPSTALNKEGHVVAPQSQPYANNTFANNVAIMAGYTTDGSTTLSHLFSFFKVTIAKGNDTGDALKAITLSTRSGRAVAGEFEIDFQSATMSPAAGKGIDNVTITNVPYVDGKAVVYLAIPGGDYVNGFALTVTAADGKTMTRNAYTTNGIEMPAGYLLNMPELTFEGVTPAEKVIATADDLINFLIIDLAQGGSFTGTAVLGADIDMTGQIFEGIEAYLPQGATLDGCGHSIKNWTTSSALIFENYGTVKNIVVDKSCHIAYNLNAGNKVHGILVGANLGTVSGCTNNADITIGDPSYTFSGNRFVGTIVGSMSAVTGGDGDPDNDLGSTKVVYSSARIENCVNNGNLSITAAEYQTLGWLYIGGIVGCYNQHQEEGLGGVFNTVNNGNITINLAAAVNRMVTIGGIVGSAGKVYNAANNNPLRSYCLLENCTNNGDIFCDGTFTKNKFYLGGITGVAHANLTSCVSAGDILFTSPGATDSESFMGGICGINTGNITDCHLRGRFELDNASMGYGFYIGGISGRNVNGTKEETKVNILNCTVSGDMDIRYYTAGSAVRLPNIGGILGSSPNTNGVADITNCEHSGALTVEVLDGGAVASRVLIGGIAGDAVKGNVVTMYNCVNSGPITLKNHIPGAKDATVAGICATNVLNIVNCQSLGDVTLEGAGAQNSIIAAVGGRLANHAVAIDGCVVDCALSYPTDAGAIAGLLQGDFWGSTNIATLGFTTPCVVKATTTINGVAVTAEDVTKHEVILGRDQKTDGVEGKSRADSAFHIAEGGVVLQ